MRLSLAITLFLVLLLPTSVFASPFLSNDDKSDYRIISKDGYSYIFSKEYAPYMSSLMRSNENLRQLYRSEFAWHLDEDTALVLASTLNQVPNGFATFSPNNLTVYYGSGPALMDDFSHSHWLTVLLTHESAHLYQLNVKDPRIKQMKSIFGNTPLILTPLLPVFLTPNILTPTFILEGNAVMNESRFGFGGRLYSGSARALVYALINAHRASPNYLINEHLEFPLTTEKYLVGGYFNLHLAEKYGIERTNQLFASIATHWLNPLLLHRSFVDRFGSGYEKEINQFVGKYLPLAEQQQRAEGPVIAKGFAQGLFNVDDEKIYFVKSDELRAYPKLLIYDKTSGELKTKSVDLGIAKSFQLSDGKYYTARSVIYGRSMQRYALVGENNQIRDETLDQFVMDKRNGRTLYSDMRQSIEHSILYVDGKYVGKSNSTALLTANGEAVYFVQNKTQRELWIGQRHVGSYEGYYGWPVSIDDKNRQVFFLAATPYGSSLFSMTFEGQIHRLSSSDVIVDGRPIDSTRWLVAEVTAKGYDYKVIPVKAFDEAPTMYHYPILERLAAKKSDPKVMSSGKVDIQYQESQQTSILTQSKPYEGWKNLRYSYAAPYLFFSRQGLSGGLDVLFTDPLQDDKVQASYFHSDYDVKSAGLIYINSRRNLEWYLGTHYHESALVLEANDPANDEVLARQNDSESFIGLSYRIFNYNDWTGTWSGELSWEKDDFYSDETKHYYGLLNSFDFQTSEQYARSFDYFRLLSFTFNHQLLSESPAQETPKNRISGFVDIKHDLGHENIFTVGFGAGVAESQGIAITSVPAIHEQRFSFQRLTPGYSIDAREVRMSQLGYKKVLNWSHYFYVFPLSLRRLAPYGIINYYQSKELSSGEKETNFAEWSYGIEFEILAFHRFPVRFLTGVIGDNKEELTSSFISIGSQLRF